VEDLLPGRAGKYRRTHAEFEFDDWALVKWHADRKRTQGID
jgi:hypothetical protein